jgi:hypothetical protein
MKKVNKHKKGEQGKTKALPKGVTNLTEQDLEQVQGGVSQPWEDKPQKDAPPTTVVHF